jgi:hypothetical protein
MMEITSRMEALDQADLELRAVAQLDELEAELVGVRVALLGYVARLRDGQMRGKEVDR